MFKTIKGRLLAVLLSFVLVTLTVAVVAYSYFVKNKDSLSEISQKIENVHLLLLRDIKLVHEIFENETINSNFFLTGKSALIDQHNKICNEIKSSLILIDRLQEQNEFALGDSIADIEIKFSNYTQIVDNIIRQILKRGFKDYGAEGKMRTSAHLLEKNAGDIGMINLLQLRRHEKDFIIRQEDDYVTKHRSLISKVESELNTNNRLSQERKRELLRLLNSYSDEFRTLVIFEKKLGLRNYGGLKKDIDKTSDKIELSLSALVNMSRTKVSSALTQMDFLYMIIGVIFALVSIISSFIISKRISRTISDLKIKIAQFVESDFTKRTVLPMNDSVNEIDILVTNVSLMEQHIVDQMAMIKKSNKDLEMLFYATSRDIRLPLIELRRLLNLAISKTNDRTILRNLELMQESWGNLYNIIDELGIVTNIRSEEMKTEAIEFEALIKNVYSEFKTLEWFNNIAFSIDIKINETFYSSPGLLRAIFRNMIENSMKYVKKQDGGNYLKISIIEQNEEAIRIEVSDNGIGIKKEYQDRIFDMFYRGTNFTSGTGLGLYIVKCSIEKLNGAIGVESEEGQGTCFTMIIPNNPKLKNTKEKILQKIGVSNLSEMSWK
jgi:signal transduction histidine kinase